MQNITHPLEISRLHSGNNESRVESVQVRTVHAYVLTIAMRSTYAAETWKFLRKEREQQNDVWRTEEISGGEMNRERLNAHMAHREIFADYLHYWINVNIVECAGLQLF